MHDKEEHDKQAVMLIRTVSCNSFGTALGWLWWGKHLVTDKPYIALHESMGVGI